MGAMSGSSTGDRLLIAMIDRPNATYFLRIQAAAASIDQVRPAFDQILQSLTYTPDGLQWTLPEGWSETAGGAMFRLATLRAPNGTEVFVTSLTPGQEVLANVNRWQGQLGLPPVTENAMPIQRIQVGTQPIIIYDAAKPPAAGPAQGNSPAPGSEPSAAAAPGGADRSPVVGPSGPGPESDLPFGFPTMDPQWQVLPPSMVAAARWQRATSQGDLKLEVFKFPTEATFSSMLGIWVERIGAPAPSEETLAEATTPVTVAGRSGQMVHWPPSQPDPSPQGDQVDSSRTADSSGAAGGSERSNQAGAEAGSPDAAKSVLVARVEIDAHAWYVKLEGSRAAVGDAEPFFRGFLQGLTPAQP
jgi:hypothetical protein